MSLLPFASNITLSFDVHQLFVSNVGFGYEEESLPRPLSQHHNYSFLFTISQILRTESLVRTRLGSSAKLINVDGMSKRFSNSRKRRGRTPSTRGNEIISKYPHARQHRPW
ncbi:hypothetical protein BDW67DRAFT_8368 [Aspergillus spinulosporus]